MANPILVDVSKLRMEVPKRGHLFLRSLQTVITLALLTLLVFPLLIRYQS